MLKLAHLIFMKRIYFVLIIVGIACCHVAPAQKFIHPGINQTFADLNYMKKQILNGEQPWKDAFERLKAATDLSFAPKPFTHVVRGPYGKPNIGGDDLSKGANMAYNCALMWYISDDIRYASKAIEIINAWSPVLWDFDYNDAKLLAGWTGHLFCNAAEILRYTNSGWRQSDIDRFTKMLMTVYYPLMRYYYPQANGNWDGAIIHSIMAIAVFTDNREMFNNAIEHFLYAPVNGSLFKYIYPSGQCQETMRDQAHVQLGLGEFAGAARIAYTQGVDLFAIGNNRIALGFEYTASFLMGKKPHAYGFVSTRAKKVRDDYEYVYRHYTSKGIDMPYSKAAADSIRAKTIRSTLIAFRAPAENIPGNLSPLKPSTIAFPTGALQINTTQIPKQAILVSPGKSIQNALDSVTGNVRWVVAKAGLHTLSATLRIPSGVTLAGEGLATVLFIDPASSVRDAVINASDDVHDVTIRNLVIEGATRSEPPSDPNSVRSYRTNQGNRGGIMFLAQKAGQMKNINFINVTVRNCTYNGVFVNGADGVNITDCDFTENGASVAPGAKLLHNLLLTNCSGINIRNSRLDTSPYGSGISLSNTQDVAITGCEIARNGYYGIHIAESQNISLTGNLIEGNDRSGVMVEFQYNGSENITVSENIIHYNDGYGVESYAVRNMKVTNNKSQGNRSSDQKVSTEKFILMK